MVVKHLFNLLIDTIIENNIVQLTHFINFDKIIIRNMYSVYTVFINNNKIEFDSFRKLKKYLKESNSNDYIITILL